MIHSRWIVHLWLWLLAMSTMLCVFSSLGATASYDEARGSSGIPFWTALGIASTLCVIAGYLSPRTWLRNPLAIALPFLLKTLLSGLSFRSFLNVEIYFFALALVLMAALSVGGAFAKSRQAHD